MEFKYRQVSIPVLTVLLSDVRGRGGFLNLSACPFFLPWESIVEELMMNSLPSADQQSLLKM